MIQRIQSVYLFLIALLIAFMFAMPVSIHKVKVGDQEIELSNSLFSITDASGTIQSLHIIPVGIMAIAVILFSLVILFMFKNLKLQLRLMRYLNLLILLLITSLYLMSDFKVKEFAAGNTYSTIFLLGAYAPLVAMFFSYLTTNAIKKDKELVESADRLR